MSDDEVTAVTAAEIAQSLGIKPGGRLECRRVSASSREVVELGWALIPLAVLVGAALMASRAEYRGLTLGLCLTLAAAMVTLPKWGPGFVAYWQRNRPSPPRLTGLAATDQGLELLYGPERRDVPWSAVRRGGTQLLAGDLNLHSLALHKGVPRVIRTAEMIADRRERAGRHGLHFPDEAGDAALSRARMTGDEADIERGLSQAEE